MDGERREAYRGYFDEHEKKYKDLPGEIRGFSADTKNVVRDKIRTKTKSIYKHYAKQVLKYAIAGAGIVLGGVALASGLLPMMIVGGVLAAGGVGLALHTRYKRDLSFNLGMDLKRVNYFWREGRAERKISKNIKKLQAMRAKYPRDYPRAKTLEAKIENALKDYESRSMEAYKGNLKEISEYDKKLLSKPGKTREKMQGVADFFGISYYDDVKDIKSAQLHTYGQAVLSQIIHADELRKEAGLKQNASAVKYVEKVFESDDRLSKKNLENIKKNNESRVNIGAPDDYTYDKERHETFKQELEVMLKDKDTYKEEDILQLATQYGMTAEETFTFSKEKGFGKRKSVEFIKALIQDAEFDKISEETQTSLIETMGKLSKTDKAKMREYLDSVIKSDEKRGYEDHKEAVENISSMIL